jgi:hypothetical protein
MVAVVAQSSLLPLLFAKLCCTETGWTGFLDLFLGHYGIEVEEENIVLFVGIIPIAIDVWFKYWIFIGLNKISPGAVVTIKQLDRH